MSTSLGEQRFTKFLTIYTTVPKYEIPMYFICMGNEYMCIVLYVHVL